jgi:hypothetical protein
MVLLKFPLKNFHELVLQSYVADVDNPELLCDTLRVLLFIFFVVGPDGFLLDGVVTTFSVEFL